MFFKVGGRGKTKLTHNNADEAAPSWGSSVASFPPGEASSLRRLGEGRVLAVAALPAVLYSSECVKEEFCELRVDGVLRSSRQVPASGIISTVEGLAPAKVARVGRRSNLCMREWSLSGYNLARCRKRPKSTRTRWPRSSGRCEVSQAATC